MKTKPRRPFVDHPGVYVELNAELAGTEDLSMQTTFTWYGKQQPKKSTIKVSQRLARKPKKSVLTACGSERDLGCDEECQSDRRRGNLFDKRLWRAGNAQTTGDLEGPTISRVPGRIPITSRDVRVHERKHSLLMLTSDC